MTADRMVFYPVIRHIASCRVTGCTWKQEHILEADAVRDGERHLAEWHATEPQEQPRVVDLMAALEASLATIKTEQAEKP